MQVSNENPADTILTVNLEFECCMKSLNLKCKYQMQVHFVNWMLIKITASKHGLNLSLGSILV